jgi:hypothetical protein
LWSAETPDLYTLMVTLRTPVGEESTRCTVGFRKIEIRERQLLTNGPRVMIHGVDYHDHDDSKGKAISRALVETDIRLMKQFNVNAVRTSHYPKHPYWYDLCDRYGIYVIDEANIEAHACYLEVCRDPAYTDAFVERVRSTVSEQYVPYVMPQEHGLKSDVRWLRLTGEPGQGLEVHGTRGMPWLHFSAGHFTAADLFAARHTVDLNPRPEAILCLDAAHRGLGTASCGPDTLDNYKLLESEYAFGYRLKV